MSLCVRLKCDLADSRAVTQDQVDLFRAQRPEIVSYPECKDWTRRGQSSEATAIAPIAATNTESVSSKNVNDAIRAYVYFATHSTFGGLRAASFGRISIYVILDGSHQ